MSQDVMLPQAGMSMTEGTIVEYLVGDGERVAAGQGLYSFETDKTEMIVDAPAGGVVRHVAAIGDTVEVGGVVCKIESD